MVRKETINGIEVVLEARPVGGLGWTWAYYPENGQGRSNSGRLLQSEEDAYKHAVAEARQHLDDQGS
jgi:hypothetical protein